MVIIFLDFFIFYQMFSSQRVKRSMIYICVCACVRARIASRVVKQLKDLGSHEIRKCHENLKTLQNDSLVPSLSPKIKILSIISIPYKNQTLPQIFYPWLYQSVIYQIQKKKQSFSPNKRSYTQFLREVRTPKHKKQ